MLISRTVKFSLFCLLFSGSAFAGRLASDATAPIRSNQITGSTSGSSAPAGNPGQIISSTTANAQPIATSTQFGNVVQLTLTPGTWIVWGSVHVIANGATVTVSQAAISVNSGNTTTDHVTGVNQLDGFLATAVINGAITIPSYPINVSTNTTVYLKLTGTYITTTPTCKGSLYALRVF